MTTLNPVDSFRLLSVFNCVHLRLDLFFTRRLARYGLLLVALCSGAFGAGNYPVKPIRIIVPYPPGGPTDILSRAIAQPLSAALGQSVIVANRAGGGGIIGTELVARAPADGYTLLWGTTGTHAINPAIYARLPYDPLKSLAPIALVAQGTKVLVVHPSVPARSVKELIALARAQPGRLNFSSAGNGATSHLAGEMFKTPGLCRDMSPTQSFDKNRQQRIDEKGA